jgi:hypothetical protein
LSSSTKTPKILPGLEGYEVLRSTTINQEMEDFQEVEKNSAAIVYFSI